MTCRTFADTNGSPAQPPNCDYGLFKLYKGESDTCFTKLANVDVCRPCLRRHEKLKQQHKASVRPRNVVSFVDDTGLRIKGEVHCSGCQRVLLSFYSDETVPGHSNQSVLSQRFRANNSLLHCRETDVEMYLGMAGVQHLRAGHRKQQQCDEQLYPIVQKHHNWAVLRSIISVLKQLEASEQPVSSLGRRCDKTLEISEQRAFEPGSGAELLKLVQDKDWSALPLDIREDLKLLGMDDLEHKSTSDGKGKIYALKWEIALAGDECWAYRRNSNFGSFIGRATFGPPPAELPGEEVQGSDSDVRKSGNSKVKGVSQTSLWLLLCFWCPGSVNALSLLLSSRHRTLICHAPCTTPDQLLEQTSTVFQFCEIPSSNFRWHICRAGVAPLPQRGLGANPFVGQVVHCNKGKAKNVDSWVHAKSMEVQAFITVVWTLLALGVGVWSSTTDGDGALGKALLLFGWPAELLPFHSLCIQHFARGLFDWFRKQFKKEMGVTAQTGLFTEAQLDRAFYSIMAALRTVSKDMRKSNLTEEETEMVLDRITACCSHMCGEHGDHSQCHSCPARLKEICPAAAEPWCPALIHAASKCKGACAQASSADVSNHVFSDSAPVWLRDGGDLLAAKVLSSAGEARYRIRLGDGGEVRTVSVEHLEPRGGGVEAGCISAPAEPQATAQDDDACAVSQMQAALSTLADCQLSSDVDSAQASTSSDGAGVSTDSDSEAGMAAIAQLQDALEHLSESSVAKKYRGKTCNLPESFVPTGGKTPVDTAATMRRVLKDRLRPVLPKLLGGAHTNNAEAHNEGLRSNGWNKGEGGAATGQKPLIKCLVGGLVTECGVAKGLVPIVDELQRSTGGISPAQRAFLERRAAKQAQNRTTQQVAALKPYTGKRTRVFDTDEVETGERQGKRIAITTEQFERQQKARAASQADCLEARGVKLASKKVAAHTQALAKKAAVANSSEQDDEGATREAAEPAEPAGAPAAARAGTKASSNGKGANSKPAKRKSAVCKPPKGKVAKRPSTDGTPAVRKTKKGRAANGGSADAKAAATGPAKQKSAASKVAASKPASGSAGASNSASAGQQTMRAGVRLQRSGTRRCYAEFADTEGTEREDVLTDGDSDADYDVAGEIDACAHEEVDAETDLLSSPAAPARNARSAKGAGAGGKGRKGSKTGSGQGNPKKGGVVKTMGPRKLTATERKQLMYKGKHKGSDAVGS